MQMRVMLLTWLPPLQRYPGCGFHWASPAPSQADVDSGKANSVSQIKADTLPITSFQFSVFYCPTSSPDIPSISLFKPPIPDTKIMQQLMYYNYNTNNHEKKCNQFYSTVMDTAIASWQNKPLSGRTVGPPDDVSPGPGYGQLAGKTTYHNCYGQKT